MEGVANVGPQRRVGWTEVAPSRRPYVILSCLLTVLLAVSAVALWETYASGRGWEKTATQRASQLQAMTVQKDQLTAQLTAAQHDLASTKATLAERTAQYNAASARIRSLADEKAQVGDKAAALAEAVVLSKQVSAELDTCVNSLEQLQGYLVNFASYDVTWLATYAGEVNGGCDKARADNAELAQALGAQ